MEQSSRTLNASPFISCPPNKPSFLATRKNTILIILLTSFINAILFGLSGYCVGKTINEYQRSNKNNLEVKLPNQLTASTASPTSPQIITPTPKLGYTRYSDSLLRYGFNYLNNQSLHKCLPDLPCVSIKDISLKVEPLEQFYFNTPNTKDFLLKNDLYCSADTPMLQSISCENINVEDFENHLGHNGYKLYRKKTITGEGAGVYNDVAYIFPLNKSVKLNENTIISGVLFSLDSASTDESNLMFLDETADSFYLY